MAMQTASDPGSPTAQVVGNAFVEQYYHILHTSPELVYRFYQDSSVLSRPDANGVMTSVATMQGINEKILSLNFKDYKAEIKTADAQKSYKEGVTVLVTGCLTGKDNLRRKFVQSFFLAPQDNGYFVLNDVFRYVEDGEQFDNHQDSVVDNIPTVPVIPNPETSHVPDPSAPDPATSVSKEDKIVAEDANSAVGSDKQLIPEKEAVAESQSHSNGNGVPIVFESTSSTQEDAPKKSYASIVKVAKGSSVTTKVYIPTSTTKLAPKKTENQAVSAIIPLTEPEAAVLSGNESPETSSITEEVEGHSIYIGNLPFNMTDSQLEMEFRTFGPIKEGGIQVRYNKQQGYCFGFVEFLSLRSMQDAIQASPMIIGGRQAVIEMKRTTTQAASGRGRFYGRPGYQNESFRGRGNYGAGRGFIRAEFGNRGEFSGRGRGSSGRGRGRGGRSGGAKQNAVST